jgi:glycosyltransferase involved in cell wall biosynthesis
LTTPDESRFRVPAAGSDVGSGAEPTFSVVVPAYQAAETIAAAVASVLEQTYPALEVIVCDDGSTDDLRSALAEFDDRVALLRQSHGGAGAARNQGISVASGDFVAMLDADDVFDPTRLAAFAELAVARPDLDILATDAYFERDGRVAGRFYDFNRFAIEDQRAAILETCFLGWPAMRRVRVLEVGGFDESHEIAPAEDWDLFIRLFLDGAAAGIVEEPLIRYRQHSGSTTSDRSRSLWSRVAVLEKTRRRSDLTSGERAVLERSLARARTRSLLTDARALTCSGHRGIRRRLLALAAGRHIPPATRLRLIAAALVPVKPTRLLGGQTKQTAADLRRRQSG